MSDGMGREFTYLSSHATNRYFIPNWGTTIQIKLPLNNEAYTQTMLMARHPKIAKLFDEDFWVTR